jgi:BTB/POZ domain
MAKGWPDSSSEEEEEHNCPEPAVATNSNIPTDVASLEGKTTTSPRSTESLWAELHQNQQNELATLQRQRAELEQEKASMNTLAPDASDIVTINVGGEVILQGHRDTLCLAAQPGSRFAALFSGRWEGHCVKDAQGRIFLDHDPELIRLIVNYLRIKRVEDPADVPVDPPTPPNEKRQEWACLLKYYGLTSLFFTKPFSPLDVSKLTVIQPQGPTKPFSPLDVSKLTVVQPQGSNITIQRVGQGLQFSNHSVFSGPYHFVACTPCLVPGTQSSWKVTISRLTGWIVMGLIGQTNSLTNSNSHSTSFGWGVDSRVYVAGCDSSGAGGWTNFTEGECLLFGLENNKLTMFSVAKSMRFVIDGVPDGEKFIHFNFRRSGTQLTLEPLDATEYAKLVA